MVNIEIINIVLKLLGVKDYNIIYTKDREQDDKRYSLNCDKIHSELGWNVSFDFNESLEYTVKWFKENYNWILNILNK